MSAPLRLVEPFESDNARLIRRHIDWLRRTGATPATQNYREGVLLRLARDLGVPLQAATFDDLDRWQSELTVGISTIAGYTSHVRVFYRWLVENAYIGADPTTRLPLPKVPRRQARPVPDADLRVALECAPEPMRTWFILAAFMGLRAMEVAPIRGDHFSEVDGRLYLDGVGKGQKPFRLPVPVEVVPILRPHLAKGSGPLWRTGPGGRPTRPLDVTNQVGKFFRSIGMGYTFHQLRHTFGTTMYRATRDLLLTQDVMRHSSPTTTRLYVETSSPEATAAMDRLSTALRGESPSC